MAVTGLSEFTFGFAFLFEQTKRDWAGLRAAPILPSLRREADDGWDAHLPSRGTDYYYQFKLSDYLSRGNAKYIRDRTYNAPYYRISLHARDMNAQHRRLRVHSATHVHTYYVAPEFQFLDDFNESFLAEQITENSRLIPVADCDDINDGDQHYLTFCAGDPTWRQHSEPKAHHRSISGKSIEGLYRESEPAWSRLDRDFAHQLLDRTRQEIDNSVRKEDRGVTAPALRLLEAPPENDSRTGLLRHTADLLSVFYGVTLVLVGSPD
jgi:hypothetical protein